MAGKQINQCKKTCTEMFCYQVAESVTTDTEPDTNNLQSVSRNQLSLSLSLSLHTSHSMCSFSATSRWDQCYMWRRESFMTHAVSLVESSFDGHTYRHRHTNLLETPNINVEIDRCINVRCTLQWWLAYNGVHKKLKVHIVCKRYANCNTLLNQNTWEEM